MARRSKLVWPFLIVVVSIAVKCSLSTPIVASSAIRGANSSLQKEQVGEPFLHSLQGEEGFFNESSIASEASAMDIVQYGENKTNDIVLSRNDTITNQSVIDSETIAEDTRVLAVIIDVGNWSKTENASLVRPQMRNRGKMLSEPNGKEVDIGGVCSSSAQCAFQPDSFCLDGRCQCRYRYDTRRNKCLSHSAVETTRMYRILILISGSGLALILILLVACVLRRSCCSGNSDSSDAERRDANTNSSIPTVAHGLETNSGYPHILPQSDLNCIRRMTGIFEKPPTYDQALKHAVASTTTYGTPPPPYSETVGDEDVLSRPCGSGSFASTTSSTHCLINTFRDET